MSPPGHDPAETALAPGAPVLQPSVNPDGNLLKQHTLECNGTLDEALAAADVVVEGAYRTPTMQHCHLENQTAYAYMDDMRHIVIVSSTQIPHICRRVVGQALGIPWSSVRVIKPYIGGGFGNKQDVVLEPIVAFLTMKLDGAPVSMELTREECMLCTRVRHAFAMTARAGATKDGKLLGYGLDVLSNTGAYASHGHSIAAAGGSKVCYVYPHATYRFSAKTFYSNIPVGGACRGYGSPQTAYAIECLMDDTARALGMDPLDFRLKNTGRNGDISPLNGKPVATLGISDCLEEGRKKFRWDERKAACKAFNEEAVRTGSPLRRGVGVSAFSYGSGTYPANVEPGSARLILNQDGTVNLMTGATEIGQGADTAFAQMVSETLGVAYENIHVISTQDTDITPWDPGAYASRQTYTCAPRRARRRGRAAPEAPRLCRRNDRAHARRPDHRADRAGRCRSLCPQPRKRRGHAARFGDGFFLQQGSRRTALRRGILQDAPESPLLRRLLCRSGSGYRSVQGPHHAPPERARRRGDHQSRARHGAGARRHGHGHRLGAL